MPMFKPKSISKSSLSEKKNVIGINKQNQIQKHLSMIRIHSLLHTSIFFLRFIHRCYINKMLIRTDLYDI